MAAIKTILLPGMDGTGRLLRGFHETAPATHDVEVVALPTKRIDGFGRLADHVAKRMPNSDRVLLIAESFSGPTAVMVAAHHPDRVIGLVLVATFVDSPVPAVGRIVPWRVLFQFEIPKVAARIALVGMTASDELVREIQDAAGDVSAEVLAHRMKMLIEVDETASLKKCQCPLLYIRPTADRLVSKRCWGTIRALRPDARLATIDGPHFILQRNPEEAWQHISEFTRAIT